MLTGKYCDKHQIPTYRTVNSFSNCLLIISECSMVVFDADEWESSRSYAAATAGWRVYSCVIICTIRSVISSCHANLRVHTELSSARHAKRTTAVAVLQYYAHLLFIAIRSHSSHRPFDEMNYLYIATLYLTFSSTANVNASVLNNRGVLSSAIEAESPQQSSSEWDQQLTNATHSEYLQQKRGVSEPKIVKRDGSKSERALFRMLTGIASTVWRVAPVVYRDFHQLDYNEQYRVSFNK